MRFEEQVQVPVSVAAAWDFLWQVQRVAACLPGCTAVEEIEPGKRYKARFVDAIGPYKANFDLDVAVEEARPREGIRLRASGQDKRLGASQQVALAVTLRGPTPDSTVLNVTADVQVLGKIAALGQFAIKRKAKDVVQQFARNVAAELAADPRPQPVTRNTASVTPPVGGEGLPAEPAPASSPFPLAGERGAGG
ncbi:MAG TPA: SRPBCC domain-containing protein [Chloroflexota bacterium]|nr:SRPBCC domain-containing protein [Chloroflexota bacterium]